MALGDQAGNVAVQTFLAGAPALIDKLTAAGHATEVEIIQGLRDTLSQEIPAVGEMEKQVIDYALKGIGTLLDNQRIALGSEIDRRFVSIGVVITALGQAISASSAGTETPKASA